MRGKAKLSVSVDLASGSEEIDNSGKSPRSTRRIVKRLEKDSMETSEDSQSPERKETGNQRTKFTSEREIIRPDDLPSEEDNGRTLPPPPPVQSSQEEGLISGINSIESNSEQNNEVIKLMYAKLRGEVDMPNEKIFEKLGGNMNANSVSEHREENNNSPDSDGGERVRMETVTTPRVTTPMVCGNMEASAVQREIVNHDELVKKGKERVARALHLTADVESSESSSDSSSSSSASTDSSEEERRRRRKKKRMKKHKYHPKKRKYRRSRSTSRSRSKINKRKRKYDEAEIQDRPEFQAALEKKLREMGYKGNRSRSSTPNRDGGRRSRSKTPKGNRINKVDTPRKINVVKSPSVDTVYTPAVPRADPSIINKIPSARNAEELINNQLSRIRLQFTGNDRADARISVGEQPGGSGEKPEDLIATAKESANLAIIQAEKFKAKLNNPTGEYINVVDSIQSQVRDDDEFVHISSHIDQSIKERIRRGEFVELEKLLKRNRSTGLDHPERDMTLDVVTREGHTYLTPKPSEKQGSISSVRKWEQAFRVYASIYSEANPMRAQEIWQYVEIINRAASKYTWENVSSYDYQFRRWMGINPRRSWAKTLTQIWNLEFKRSESPKS